MTEIPLHGSLGHSQMDAVVHEVIGVYEATFPGQIAAYYVEGSYADQTQLPTSDLDLVIVFRHRFADAEARSLAERLWTSQHLLTSEVDITIVEEDRLRGGVPPNVKLGGRLLYGQDVCRLYPLLPIEAWTRERMHAAYWLLIKVYHRPTPVHLPLAFPAPSDEFYGYINRTLRLPDGREVPCTRNLVRTTGWAATALLALQAGQYVGRKRDCARLYREQIGDEWSSLLEALAHSCRDEWQYRIPTASHARKFLRELCERTLQFEQHFLTRYKSYLLEQFRASEQEHVRTAMLFQEQLPLEDAEVTTMLQTLRQQEGTQNGRASWL
jgi:predicted nucleotidyltransferase